MSTLKEKAEQVLVEKTNKIIPDNIKDGVEIFGVSGNIDESRAVISNGVKFTGSTNLDMMTFINTKNITDFKDMFKNTTSTSMDITGLITDKATTMESMFYKSKFTNMSWLDNLNYSNVISMREFLYMNSGVSSLTFSNKDFSKLNTMVTSFAQMSALTNVTITNCVFGNTNLNAMMVFSSDSNLTDITLTNCSFNGITDAYQFFGGCSNLVNLDLTNTTFNNSSTFRMDRMFNGCSKLSNESLNGILAFLLNTNSPTKTLKYLGLTETQANICKTLSNWSACEEAGWKDGYTTDLDLSVGAQISFDGETNYMQDNFTSTIKEKWESIGSNKYSTYFESTRYSSDNVAFLWNKYDLPIFTFAKHEDSSITNNYIYIDNYEMQNYYKNELGIKLCNRYGDEIEDYELNDTGYYEILEYIPEENQFNINTNVEYNFISSGENEYEVVSVSYDDTDAGYNNYLGAVQSMYRDLQNIE